MSKRPPDLLTVIFSDYGSHAQEPVVHRSVRIELTTKQQEQLTSRNDGDSWSQCFLEYACWPLTEEVEG